MAKDFLRLMQELKRFAPSLKGQGSESWNANQPDTRNKIRESIAVNLPRLPADEAAMIKNLNIVPELSDWSVSISHCPIFGGWLAVPRPQKVGFDTEALARLRPEVIERIATKEEIKIAPDSRFLWCAKEAIFKALENQQPSTASQIQIEEWRNVGDRLYYFHTQNPSPARGLLIETTSFLLAGSLIG